MNISWRETASMSIARDVGTDTPRLNLSPVIYSMGNCGQVTLICLSLDVSSVRGCGSRSYLTAVWDE